MSKKVLVVDDMMSVRMLVKMYLEQAGYELDEAEDGLEALKRIQVFRPDIVLLDVMMPNMHGIECCQCIKGNVTTKRIPVIMMTSRDEYVQREKAHAAGCNAYLIKPINKEELLSIVELLLIGS